MLSSKKLLEESGLSRATLNNYIVLGLLPKPVVRHPDEAGDKARRLGYFPADALDVIREIEGLKKSGLRMAEIAARIGRPPAPAPTPAPARPVPATAAAPAPKTARPRPASEARGLMLTIGDLDYPAYLVNNKFEVEWANDQAESKLFGQAGSGRAGGAGDSGLSADIAERNIFHLLRGGGVVAAAESRDEVLSFHLAIAKNRLSKTALLTLDPEIDGGEAEELAALYDRAQAMEPGGIADTEVNLAPRPAAPERHRLYATFFREGIFFAYVPGGGEGESLLSLLSRRDLVIRDLLRSRRPYMTPLAVLVADIENSVKICAELPPEEYFELINQVWGAMEPKFRQYYATHGKHVGDGMVYYFFPQPDCNYVFNALQCAHEMREEMAKIDRAWRQRKNWTNELKLNIGLDEGQEWFGAYQTPTHLEFTVLGDTINRAARLSDFARGGTVWATKNLLGSLNGRERDCLDYGIRRRAEDGHEIIVSATYSRVSNLVDTADPKHLKFQDIAVLPVTEVLGLVNGADG